MCALLVGLAGCGGAGGGAEARADTTVIAGFYPLAFAAEELGGRKVEVTNLTPPGAEPHDVELSARDVERVRNADVVLYLGAGFQPALEEAAEEARGEVVDVLTGLSPRRESHAQSRESGQIADPHVWLDPVRYRQLVGRIAAAVGDARKAGPFRSRLGALHREFERGLERCQRRQFVTSHAAFGYLADRYRLRQIPITGVSPEAEPSARDLERVIAEVRKRGATTVFFETLVSPRLARTVAREADVRTDVLNPVEGLTEDEIRAGEDYFSLMRGNLAALRQALGCR